MTSPVSFRLISGELRSRKKEIQQIGGDSVKIEQDVLTITGAAKPFEEIQIKGSTFRVSPVQRVLLEIVSKLQWESVSFVYSGKPWARLLKTPNISSSLLEIGDGYIKVKSGRGFMEALVSLTTILQAELVGDMMRADADQEESLENRRRKMMKFQDDVKFRILCPAIGVGALIGNKGEKLKEIGHKTSAFVTVLTEVEEVHENKRVVEVVGSGRKNVTLRDINMTESMTGSYAQMGLVMVADRIMEIDLKAKASVLVDSEFLSNCELQSLSNSSGARVSIKPAPAIADSDESVIQMKGMRHEVLKGLVAVSALIQQQQQ